MISVEVSIGEALDKLTILQIKNIRINDPIRLREVQKEYDTLKKDLDVYMQKEGYLFSLLLNINNLIWDVMDKLRDCKERYTPDEYNLLCKDCIDYNDIRFRIKNMINIKLSSELKEQKGYQRHSIYIHINTDPSNKKIYDFLMYMALMHDQVYANIDFPYATKANESIIVPNKIIIDHISDISQYESEIKKFIV